MRKLGFEYPFGPGNTIIDQTKGSRARMVDVHSDLRHRYVILLLAPSVVPDDACAACSLGLLAVSSVERVVCLQPCPFSVGKQH